MKNKARWAKCFRRPHTTQERRANPKKNKFARAKRNQKNLVDSWYDKTPCVQKTWKVKRQTQYRVDGRGEKHQLFLSARSLSSWKLEEWFKNHDIPHRLQPIMKVEFVLQTHRMKYVEVGTRQKTVVHKKPKSKKKNKEITQYESRTYSVPVYRYKPIRLEEPVKRKRRFLTGYMLTWWSDKKIDVDKILGQCRI